MPAPSRAFVLAVAVLALLVPSPRSLAGGRGFEAEQLAYPRVRTARTDAAAHARALFARAGVPFPPAAIHLRVFKREKQLELWARGRKQHAFRLVKTYAVCASSGGPGPKRLRGDGQVPEGFYRIDRFNPRSQFLLSLGIDYPNRADRIRSKGQDPGGSIFIHGSCVTIGCIPITDPEIEELYWIAVEARSAGQKRIGVDVFPFRLTEAALRAAATDAATATARNQRASLVRFWRTLKRGYDVFERTHRPARVTIGPDGKYLIHG